MKFTIRPYHCVKDAQDVYALWQAVFGKHWPITLDLFQQVTTEHDLYHDGDHYVATAGSQVVGFISTQLDRSPDHSNPAGGIGTLMVHPDHRRQGIGTALHQTALQHLKQSGTVLSILGGGGLYRFWPGIPDEYIDSRDFFFKMGWENFLESWDLTRHLGDYTTPLSISQKMLAQGIDLHPIKDEAEIQAVLAFEEREFPHWLSEFSYKINKGDHDEILVAWEPGKGVVGTLLMFTPQSHYLSVNLVWKTLLGYDLGGLGAVGVAQSEQGRGIGIALVAWASEILKARGVGNSMIDWTEIVDFYRKIGYQPWRHYLTSFRVL